MSRVLKVNLTRPGPKGIGSVAVQYRLREVRRGAWQAEVSIERGRWAYVCTGRSPQALVNALAAL